MSQCITKLISKRKTANRWKYLNYLIYKKKNESCKVKMHYIYDKVLEHGTYRISGRFYCCSYSYLLSTESNLTLKAQISTHYENMPIQIFWKFYHQKIKKSYKNSDIFHVSAQNIDCGYSLEPPRRGGSNEYTQSMFLSRNKKNNVYPCKPQFYYIKVGFKGVKII